MLVILFVTKYLFFFSTAKRNAEDLHTKCTKLFHDMLDIDSEVIVLNASDTESDGMKKLKDVLKRRKENIIVRFNKIE